MPNIVDRYNILEDDLHCDKQYDHAPILLETVFELMPDVRLSVELKVETPKIVEKVIDLIKKYDRANYTRLNLKDYNQYVRDLNFISTEVNDFEQNFMSILFLAGLTPFIRHDMHTYYMPFISNWLQNVILER